MIARFGLSEPRPPPFTIDVKTRRTPKRETRKKSVGLDLFGCSHLGIRILDHDSNSNQAVVPQSPQRIRSTKLPLPLEEDCPPTKPERQTSNPNCSETWRKEFFGDANEDSPPTQPRGAPAAVCRKSPGKWHTSVYTPSSPPLPPSRTTNASPPPTSAVSPRSDVPIAPWKRQTEDTPDFQPTTPVRKKLARKSRFSLQDYRNMQHQPLKSVTSQTYATEEITTEDTADDMSEITNELDYVKVVGRKSGIPTTIVQAFFIPNLSTNTDTSSDDDDEAAATKYRKMLRMKVPVPSVRHKMIQDGVDARIVALVVGQDMEPVVSAPTQEANAATDDEAAAAKYRKMLRMKVPVPSVRHKMIQDGVDARIVALVVGQEADSALATAPSLGCPSMQQSTSTKTPPARTSSQLVPLHWTPLSGEALGNSVWNKSGGTAIATTQPEMSNKLAALFQKKIVSPIAKKSTLTGPTPKTRLLDLSRSNNVAISLKSFKRLSLDELRDMIAFCDPTHRLRGEQVEFLRDILPTASEARTMEAYDGVQDQLVTAESWFYKVVSVQRREQKISVIRTMEMFGSEAVALSGKMSLLTRVCHQVTDSHKLQSVLEAVLQVGNMLNEGTRTGGAAGFKFDSLLKLTETKSSDNKTTVLDFLVSVLVANGQRDSLSLSAEFPDCSKACRLSIADLVNQVGCLRKELQECENELDALKGERSGKGVVPKRPRGTAKATFKPQRATAASVGEVRSQLMTSLLARSKESSSTIAEVKQVTEGNTEVVETNIPASQLETPSAAEKNSMHAGIKRLEEFIRKGKGIVEKLESSRLEAIDAGKALSAYCGEGSSTDATSTLLGILTQFAANVDSAVERFDKEQQVEVRRQKRKDAIQQDQGEDIAKAPVSRANDERSDSGDAERSQSKADSQERKVYRQASNCLDAMYEREKKVVKPSRKKAPWRSDLVAERDGRKTIEGFEAIFS